ncbi:MAG TPA: hypothetical protein VHA53_06855 [Nitrolancea sp.]|nr:hypothetical protein [Nitrolancea sp.]
MTGAADLSFTLGVDRRHGWLLIPLQIEQDPVISMVLDTGSARSAISHSMFEKLNSLRRLTPYGTGRYVIQGLGVQGQRFPDLYVSVRSRVTEVGADGIVGLDVLSQFREIHFERETMTLSLRGWSPR